MPKKSGKPKVKIVPPHRWPPFFPALGVYDVMHNNIYLHEGLSKTTCRQTLKHEKAHRRWFLNHQTIRKFYIFLYVSPALYYVLAMFVTIVSLFLSLLWVKSLIFYFALLSIILPILHLIMFCIIFEIPAWKAAGILIKGAGVKKTLQSLGIWVITLILPFLLMYVVFFVFSARAAFVFFSFGILASWFYLIYIYLATLTILRRSNSKN